MNNYYRAGTDLIAFRAVKRTNDFSLVVIATYPPSKAGDLVGVAQHAVSIPPGGKVNIADSENDLFKWESGAAIAYGEQLTTDDLGRAVPALAGRGQPVLAYARRSAGAVGEIIEAVMAPKGLTT